MALTVTPAELTATALTLTTAAQPNITSVGTLTTLTVDDITINSSTISDAGDLGITSGGLLTIDVAGNIILDADGGEIQFKDGGAHFARIFQSGGNFYLNVPTQDTDLIIQGNDGGSNVNALTFDMSEGGRATFASRITFGDHIIGSANGGYLQVRGTGDRYWVMGSTGGNTAPTTASATLGFHHYDGSSWTQNKINITASGKLGVGTDNPDTELHVFNSDSGATPTGNTVATFEGNDNTEISILGGSSSVLALNFGHSGDNNEGMLYFNTTNGSENMQLDSSKDITFRNTAGNGPAGKTYFKAYNTDIMTIDGSNNRVVIGDTSSFASLHVKYTGWSSGSPYGTVQLIEGNNTNDANWSHLVITDTTTANGNGGSISFATGAASALNPFAGIKGAAEGTSYGGLRLLTRPSSGTNMERYAIKADGKHMFYGMDTNSTYSAMALGHITEGNTGGYISSWTNVFAHRLHIRTNGTSTPSQHGTTTMAGSGKHNFRIMNNIGYNGVYWNASTETGVGTKYEMDNGTHYWANTNSVASGSQYAVTYRMFLNASGNLYITGTLAENQTISDARLKQDVEDFPSALEKMKALRTVKFNWIDEERRGEHKEIGLIAQEVKEIYPELIGTTDAIDAKEDPETLEKIPGEERYMMHYQKLSVVLLKAMQEQQELIETLQTKVAALENK